MIASIGRPGIDVGAAVERARRNGDQTVVWLWGEHDMATQALVSTTLTEAIDGSDSDVVVDLSDVPYMAAAIIHPLLRCRALLASRDRRLTVRSPQSCPQRLLEVCDLTDLIESAPTAGNVSQTSVATTLET